MKHNENIQIICSSLATMGLVDVGESLQGKRQLAPNSPPSRGFLN